MSAIQATVPIQTLVRLMVAAQVCQNVTLPSIQKPSLASNCNCGTRESRVLPPGYVAFPEYGLAYKYFANPVSYNEAISLCSNENGQLAVIDSREKVQKVLDQICDRCNAWIGLGQFNGSTEWSTIDGKSRNNLPWGTGQPDGDYKCVYLSEWFNGVTNWDCQEGIYYLCEITLPRN